MTSNFLVAARSARGANTGDKTYATVSPALETAQALLGEGAGAVWIIDSEGNAARQSR
jgi:hypothetical protein